MDHPSTRPDDWGLWGYALALHEGYRNAFRTHDRWSCLFEDGDQQALNWAQACKVGMDLEAKGWEIG